MKKASHMPKFINAPFPTFQSLCNAYRACRLGKKASYHQIRFEFFLGRNLHALYRELLTEKYRPLPSVCFTVEKPKPREIFAANFRDRIVHHFLVSHLSPYWEKKFIHSSFACRIGRGTHGAHEYLQKKVRSISKGNERNVYALKLDIAAFFVTIHRPTLCKLITKNIQNTFVKNLTELLYQHDARVNVICKNPPNTIPKIPHEKSWFSQIPENGIPIGNLTSQFGANIYLNDLDHFIQRKIKPQAYLRYMDDLLLLDSNPDKLRPLEQIIDAWLNTNRSLSLNKQKTKFVCLDKGIEYLGYLAKQGTSSKQPLQYFLPPIKKWGWIQKLNTISKREIPAYEKNHVLALTSIPKYHKQTLSQINSSLGYISFARSHKFRKRSLEKFLCQSRKKFIRFGGGKKIFWNVRRDYKSIQLK